MKTLIALLLMTAAELPVTTSAFAQYGGPPMWSRDYRDYPPPRRDYPRVGPCIYRGECAGPPGRQPYYGLPPRRIPSPRYYPY